MHAQPWSEQHEKQVDTVQLLYSADVSSTPMNLVTFISMTEPLHFATCKIKVLEPLTPVGSGVRRYRLLDDDITIQVFAFEDCGGVESKLVAAVARYLDLAHYRLCAEAFMVDPSPGEEGYTICKDNVYLQADDVVKQAFGFINNVSMHDRPRCVFMRAAY